jgi:hypothetical protein
MSELKLFGNNKSDGNNDSFLASLRRATDSQGSFLLALNSQGEVRGRISSFSSVLRQITPISIMKTPEFYKWLTAAAEELSTSFSQDAFLDDNTGLDSKKIFEEWETYARTKGVPKLLKLIRIFLEEAQLQNQNNSSRWRMPARFAFTSLDTPHEKEARFGASLVLKLQTRSQVFPSQSSSRVQMLVVERIGVVFPRCGIFTSILTTLASHSPFRHIMIEAVLNPWLLFYLCLRLGGQCLNGTNNVFFDRDALLHALVLAQADRTARCTKHRSLLNIGLERVSSGELPYQPSPSDEERQKEFVYTPTNDFKSLEESQPPARTFNDASRQSFLSYLTTPLPLMGEDTNISSALGFGEKPKATKLNASPFDPFFRPSSNGILIFGD